LLGIGGKLEISKNIDNINNLLLSLRILAKPLRIEKITAMLLILIKKIPIK